jgi:hypothetical protein
LIRTYDRQYKSEDALRLLAGLEHPTIVLAQDSLGSFGEHREKTFIQYSNDVTRCQSPIFRPILRRLISMKLALNPAIMGNARGIDDPNVRKRCHLMVVDPPHPAGNYTSSALTTIVHPARSFLGVDEDGIVRYYF